MSATVSRQHPATLPVPATPFLARLREVDAVLSLIRDRDQRLVTITGPGGVGKTRLAIEAAARAQDHFRGDIVFVPLASVREPELALMAVGQGIGLYSDQVDMFETRLVEALRPTRMLLVLDNLEQVLGVAPALSRMLAQCPDLTMLTTSRESLGIQGEFLYPLVPLETPEQELASVGDILRTDAVSLFVHRARDRNPSLVIDEAGVYAIGSICRKLDGLPLAIELAAARSNLLTPQALLARMDDRFQILGSDRQDIPDRQRTMQQAVGWSHDLLTPAERGAFRALSVFVDGFAFDSAQAMLSSIGDAPADELLDRLVGHSLVQVSTLPAGDARYLMLDTVRSFGQGMLQSVAGEEHRIRTMHAEQICALCEASERQLHGPDQQEWMERLDIEVGNLRAAMAWSLANGRDDLVLRACSALAWFLANRGMVTEGYAWLTQALAASGISHQPYRGKALVAVAGLALEFREDTKADDLFRQALHLAEANGDTRTALHARHGLGSVHIGRGDYASALAQFELALDQAEQLGDERLRAREQESCGIALYIMGEWDRSYAMLEDAIRGYARAGDVYAEANVATTLAHAAYESGDLLEARRHIVRALHLHRKLESSRDLPMILMTYAQIAGGLGEHAEAHHALDEALPIIRDHGDPLVEVPAITVRAQLMMQAGDEVEAAKLVVKGADLLAGHDDPIHTVEMAMIIAMLCSRRGHHGTAVEFLAANSAIRDQVGFPATPRAGLEIDAMLAEARAALGNDGYDAAWETGCLARVESLPGKAKIAARTLIGTQQPPPVAGPDGSESSARHTLTARELEILRLLAQGHSTDEVADALFVSPRTIGKHIANILAKLDVPSRTAAVAWALRSGIA